MPVCENCGVSYEKPEEDFWYDATCHKNRYATYRFCSIKCGREYIKKRVIATNRERYGADHIMQTKEGQDRLRDSMIETHGVAHPTQIPGLKERAAAKRKEKMPQILEKCKATWREHYGVDHPGKSEVIKEKRKRTCRQRYGYDYKNQTPESREHMHYKMASQEVQDKMKQTCLERYGYEHWTGTRVQRKDG